MQDSIKSVIRHFLTALAALGTYLASASLIPAEQAADVNAAGAALADPLTLILTALAVPLARWAVSWFPWLGKGGGGSAAVLMAAAGTLAGSLPSCGPQAAADFETVKKAVPFKGCYIDKNGNRICYSTTDGVSLEVDERSGK